MEPFIKWAGGKRRFAKDIYDAIGGDISKYNHYYEPFLGSGALLLHMTPHAPFCSDINEELINLYKVVKDDVNGLVELLANYFLKNHIEYQQEFYKEVRAWDKDIDYSKRSSIEKAARLLYLNRTCYNGLWRVNRNGNFNVPFGKYKNPLIVPESQLRSASEYFNAVDIVFSCMQPSDAVVAAEEGDLVYLDPPYDVELNASGFISYTKSGFNRVDQYNLKTLCDSLIERGATVAISNSGTEYIQNLYLGDTESRYLIKKEFSVNRTIGSTPESRRTFKEILIIGQ